MLEDAVNVTLVTEQVRVPGAAMLAFGTPALWVTVVEAEAVQPLDGSVTVMVYVPDAVAV